MDSEQFIGMTKSALESISKSYRSPYDYYLYERILCYEFYHQFRLLMGEENAFVLHGELDKRYREVQLAPDFVFHIPGNDEENNAIIEFKTTKAPYSEIAEDLRKINVFLGQPFAYKIGILAICGRQPHLKLIFERLLAGIIDENKTVLIGYDVDNGKVEYIRNKL